jgi:type III secretion system low calcium response chaperone LcrH/SycD
MPQSTQEQIQAAMVKTGVEFSPELEQKAIEAIEKVLSGKVSPREALGFGDAEMNEIYKYAYNEFQAGRYDQALEVFLFLRKFDASNYNYCFAIAACHQYKNEYNEAAANFLICSYLEPLNPIPSFHLFDCFVKLNYPISALKFIKETIALAELNPDYTQIKEKALLEYKSFKKELKKYLKENFDKDNLDKEFVDLEGE